MFSMVHMDHSPAPEPRNLRMVHPHRVPSRLADACTLYGRMLEVSQGNVDGFRAL
jgi:hypothetical protein